MFINDGICLTFDKHSQIVSHKARNVFQWLRHFNQHKQHVSFAVNSSLGFPICDAVMVWSRVQSRESRGSESSAVTSCCDQSVSHADVMVRWNMLGLLGVDSPLPSYLFVVALYESGKKWEKWLAPFHQRLYELLVALWYKYRPLAVWEVDPTFGMSYWLHLRGTFLHGANNQHYLAASLKKLQSRQDVRAWFQVAAAVQRVIVEPHRATWVRHSQPTVCGADSHLGKDAVLGQRVLMAGHLLDIHLYLPRDQAIRWLRFQPFSVAVHQAFRSFLCVYLNYICTIHVVATELASICLGRSSERLGAFVVLGGSTIAAKTMYGDKWS